MEFEEFVRKKHGFGTLADYLATYSKRSFLSDQAASA